MEGRAKPKIDEAFVVAPPPAQCDKRCIVPLVGAHGWYLDLARRGVLAGREPTDAAAGDQDAPRESS